MKCVLVYQPKSGSALGQDEIRARFRDADITVLALIEVTKDLQSQLNPWIQASAIIAVIGGDGTISIVTSLIAGTHATLAPLPGGTLNHFTKDIGVSQNIDEALVQIKTAKPRYIDVGRVNDRYFINNSSIGIYPATLQLRSKVEARGITKWFVALWASIRALIQLRSYRIELDGRMITTPFVFVGNNRYILDKVGTADRTRLDEGVLTVFVIKTRSRLVLCKMVVMALIGRVRQALEFDEYYPQQLTLTRKQPLVISIDGELVRISTPLEYKVQPCALKVLV